MKTFDYTVKDKVGIHARPAGFLAKTAKEFESEITIKKGEKTADCKKLMAVMGLGVKHGDTVTVTVNGCDEEEAEKTVKGFFEENL